MNINIKSILLFFSKIDKLFIKNKIFYKYIITKSLNFI